ncbi:hypothetical protein C8Z91_16245 [Paenibacillus elgii]|uniref:Uncharacterized protein n=1 Tax=Paenibacillus elgii TaxID=189691 RepID=A0A2T6G283_9BACL|nr:RHS repeat domain-containing protein [Paenibacillus elgii]PUA38264.1 hypothetical protein C8Z91_16245 [Paenibacillus elgii]
MLIYNRNKRILGLGFSLIWLLICCSVNIAAANPSSDYLYDVNGQLLNSTGPNGSQVFQYDKNGNLVKKIRSDNLLINRNGSFETVGNHETLPKFWERTWPNAQSQGQQVFRNADTSMGGSYSYRLYSGSSNPAAMIYGLSDNIPVIGGQAYEARALMRYALSLGGHVEFSIIEVDANDNNVNEHHVTYRNGGWTVHDNANDFVTNTNTTHINIRFAVGGELNAYLDVGNVRLTKVDINGSFETVGNHETLPKFWERTWPNAQSQGQQVFRNADNTMGGNYTYRLYSGSSNPAAMIYGLSDNIPVIGGQAYEARALMRYALSSGGHAEFSIIEVDANDNNVNEHHVTYRNGGGTVHDNANDFVTNANTTHINIRFAVGGELNAYLDVDNVRLFKK